MPTKRSSAGDPEDPVRSVAPNRNDVYWPETRTCDMADFVLGELRDAMVPTPDEKWCEVAESERGWVGYCVGSLITWGTLPALAMNRVPRATEMSPDEWRAFEELTRAVGQPKRTLVLAWERVSARCGVDDLEGAFMGLAEHLGKVIEFRLANWEVAQRVEKVLESWPRVKERVLATALADRAQAEAETKPGAAAEPADGEKGESAGKGSEVDLTNLQRDCYHALAGTAFTLDALTGWLQRHGVKNPQRKPIEMGGVKNAVTVLKAKGLVKHKRGRGFYRPNALPDDFEQ